MKTPQLINAAEMARQYPATFSVPPGAAIATLDAGDFAKVCVAVLGYCERFWVEIKSRDGDIFVGRVDNELVAQSLSLGDLITFHADNIYDVRKTGTRS